ncbi:YjcZ family sporulation protein [Paenibacillus allorhizosphaerae]|uniref:Sporulation protein YjcZ n=1 Tax=Paenibacillus allorhizosphaerae TaxID=2849866 RepID=A0ABN7TS84_9BACL|nr:YjcZ family sporulation protein [Paenibacillus allorhizosphaerae]CAG7653646.1 hypothetical protein PAECIP111802_05548 [Paenibacillus allorhizosphaerae]
MGFFGGSLSCFGGFVAAGAILVLFILLIIVASFGFFGV